MSVSLYFHIPFCTKKCPYCHFYVIPNRQDLRSVLSEGLELEWNWRLPELFGKQIVSIYFGGGTPTLFPEGIANILQKIRSSGLELSDDCEITVEGNPDEISKELLDQLLASGVNRLSLGVQSLDDSSLQVLERSHSAKKAKQSILEAKEAGFTNISIDLMFDLPWQTEASWQATLNQIPCLPITHLSLYNLTIEPHTVFFKRQEALKPNLPQEELSLRLLELAIASIEDTGLGRYEISAFAKPGYESRHNSGYWTARPFLGFGPSAFSYWKGKRFRNAANLQRYSRCLRQKEAPIDFEEELLYPDNVNELLAVQLRLLKGVDVKDKNLPQETLITLLRLQQEGYLTQEKTLCRLTNKGLLFYDLVASEII